VAESGASAEQRALRETVRTFLADHAPVGRARSLGDSVNGYDTQVWRQLAEIGLLGLVIPEAFGGGGYSRAERGIVLQEAGRVLLSAPYLATAVLAVEALLAAGDEDAMKAVLPGIAAGDIVATVALGEHWFGPGQAAGSDAVRASRLGPEGGWRLDGSVRFVLDGCHADVVLVPASGPDGCGLFLVEASEAGLGRQAMTTLDLTRRQATITFDGVLARAVGATDAGAAIVARTLEHAVIALAAEQVGAAERCLEMAVDYAKTRVQFGHPIGSFQAIKHKCADLLLEIESARSAAYYAASICEPGDEFTIAAALAGAYCSTAFVHAASENIQVHGGIGFTWEHDAHLYFRRAKSSQVIFGTPGQHRRVLAGALGLAVDYDEPARF
jgi:alkylation response protein AidB-like acyl-CoA dehydrogenase